MIRSRRRGTGASLHPQVNSRIPPKLIPPSEFHFSLNSRVLRELSKVTMGHVVRRRDLLVAGKPHIRSLAQTKCVTHSCVVAKQTHAQGGAQVGRVEPPCAARHQCKQASGSNPRETPDSPLHPSFRNGIPGRWSEEGRESPEQIAEHLQPARLLQSHFLCILCALSRRVPSDNASVGVGYPARATPAEISGHIWHLLRRYPPRWSVPGGEESAKSEPKSEPKSGGRGRAVGARSSPTWLTQRSVLGELRIARAMRSSRRLAPRHEGRPLPPRVRVRVSAARQQGSSGRHSTARTNVLCERARTCAP